MRDVTFSVPSLLTCGVANWMEQYGTCLVPSTSRCLVLVTRVQGPILGHEARGANCQRSRSLPATGGTPSPPHITTPPTTPDALMALMRPRRRVPHASAEGENACACSGFDYSEGTRPRGAPNLVKTTTNSGPSYRGGEHCDHPLPSSFARQWGTRRRGRGVLHWQHDTPTLSASPCCCARDWGRDHTAVISVYCNLVVFLRSRHYPVSAHGGVSVTPPAIMAEISCGFEHGRISRINTLGR